MRNQRHHTKKVRPPLDTQFLVLYSMDSCMDAHAKWTGKRGNAALSKGFARTGVLAPSRSVWTAAYSAAFDQLTTSIPNHPRAMNSIGRNRANPAQPSPPAPPTCPPEAPAETEAMRREVHVSRFTFHVLPRRSPGSRTTHQPIVTAKVHRFYSVSTPFFDSLFAILFPLRHLQYPIHQIVTIRCNSWLTFLPKSRP
jgi:hypothetical protein